MVLHLAYWCHSITTRFWQLPEWLKKCLQLLQSSRDFAIHNRNLIMRRYSKWCKQLISVNLRQNVAYGLWNWSSNTLYNATQVSTSVPKPFRLYCCVGRVTLI